MLRLIGFLWVALACAPMLAADTKNEPIDARKAAPETAGAAPGDQRAPDPTAPQPAAEPQGLGKVAPGAIAVGPSACDACPQPAAPDATIARLESVTGRIEKVASDAAAKAFWDPTQDMKTVLLNVVSNRLDKWIFGSGAGSPGAAAYVAAATALAAAGIKFILAVSLLVPGSKPGSWQRFTMAVRETWLGRWTNAGLSLILLVAAVAAFYAVSSARLQVEVTQAPFEAMNNAFLACQAEVTSLRAQRPSPTLDITSVRASLDKVSTSCDQAVAATNQELVQIKRSTNETEAKQPWALTKLLTFCVLVFLVVFAVRKW